MNGKVKVMGCWAANIVAAGVFSFVALIVATSPAEAREVTYTGAEQTVYVKPGEPTQLAFPGEIEGGFKRKQSNLVLERQDNYLIVFAQPTLTPDGEAIIVHLDDKRTYALRVAPSSPKNPRDGYVNINDTRLPEVETEAPAEFNIKKNGFAPPTIVSGLMREMILVAEFGKKKGIVGYRRSNRYSGETVLHDGAVKAEIDEIFMGPDLWGYVLSVENQLETGQKVNPASFRLDGTRAVGAQRWELAPKPLTEEQKIADAHRTKIYVITRSKRR